MKPEKLFPILTAAVLSGMLAVGAVGCLVTGFNLELESLKMVFFLCCAAAAVFSGLFAWKWGGPVIACLLALLGGWLWHRGLAWEQLLSLLVRISRVYHDAYNWGYFLFAEPEGAVDLPLALLGGLIALFASRSLLRGKGITLSLMLAALPLASCMVVTDTVPDIRYLFILMAAFILCMLTQSVRRESLTQGCRLTAMAALPVLLALAALFLAVPQEGYVNQSKEIQEEILAFVEDLPSMAQATVEEISVGVSDDGQRNLDLKRMGPRPRYTHAVMDVTADTGGTLYLRGQDYDAYTGTGWTASPHRAEPFGLKGETAGSVAISTRTKKDVLYLPYYAAGDITLAGGFLKNEDGQTEYAFEYTSLPENWQESLTETLDPDVELTNLEISQFGSTADRLRYVSLPGQTRVKAEEILRTILPDGASRWETAEAIGEFVRNSAGYDLNTGRMPKEEEDFALWFLEESDTGYCVHFATAAVVLLRAADIPARYVTGYMAQAEAGETVTVTAGEAHAWAEYYMPQLKSWVVLEATPAEEAAMEDGPAAESTDAAETIPESTGALEETQTMPSTQPEMPTLPEAPEEDPVSLGWLYGVLIGLLAVLGVWAQRQLRLTLRRKGLENGTANQRGLVRWTETVRLCRLRKQRPPEMLNALAQKAKFSQHILTDEELAQFDRFLAQSRAELQKRPWYWQLLYRYIWAVY